MRAGGGGSYTLVGLFFFYNKKKKKKQAVLCTSLIKLCVESLEMVERYDTSLRQNFARLTMRKEKRRKKKKVTPHAQQSRVFPLPSSVWFSRCLSNRRAR